MSNRNDRIPFSEQLLYFFLLSFWFPHRFFIKLLPPSPNQFFKNFMSSFKKGGEVGNYVYPSKNLLNNICVYFLEYFHVFGMFLLRLAMFDMVFCKYFPGKNFLHFYEQIKQKTDRVDPPIEITNLFKLSFWRVEFFWWFTIIDYARIHFKIIYV